MSTLREQAQFIDELRQHYRRLDGLLVRFGPRLSLADCMEFTQPVLALRKLLFASAMDPNMPPGPQLNNPVSERAESEVGGGSPAGAVLASRPLRLVDPPEGDEDRELSTAEELYAGTALGRGGGVPW